MKTRLHLERQPTSRPADSQLLNGLREGLSRYRVKAWRLHLETPGVQTSVSQLRGVWGAALHQSSPQAYQFFFSGAAAPKYLMRPVPPGAEAQPAIELVLLGEVPEAIEAAVWEAWGMACQMGLGKHRYPFRIMAVHPLAWDGTVLSQAIRQPGFVLHPSFEFRQDEACRLLFPAPLRLIYRRALIEQPSLPDIMIASLRRLHLLQPDLFDVSWSHREQWLQYARTLPCRPWQGQRLNLVRYSASQQQDVNMHGVSGWLELPKGPGLLADLLAAASWIHVGKGTVMGLGQLQLEACD